MTRFRLQLVALSLSFFLLGSATGQDDSEYDQWKKQFLGEYDEYKSEIDREFSAFLKKDWKKFDTKTGIKRDPVPKPVNFPVDKPPVTKKVPALPPIKFKEPVKAVVEPEPLPPAVSREGKKYSINFLGHKLDFYVNFGDEIELESPLTQQVIQQSFDRLARADYEDLVKDLATVRQKLQLNDWALGQLIIKLSDAIKPRALNESRLITWFLMLKSEVKSRIAFGNNEIFLLLPSKQPLFDITYFKYSNEKFYIITQHRKIPSGLKSYNGDYPKPLKLADFSNINKIKIGNSVEYRNISFDYGQNKFNLKIPFNRNAIEFLGSYPQMDIKNYFNVVIAGETREALLSQLKPIVSRLDQQEAVNFLLRLVQTGFDYKTDQDQFGAENYLFLEETIFYASSDCEDRAVLFGWLVENLLGLKVVGLDFPGHVASAVNLTKAVGDTIVYRGETFTIADPTYINALVGRKMPKYQNSTPRVIAY